MKKKTLEWLSNLPDDDQSAIIDLAVKQRRIVSKECRDEEKKRTQQREQKILDEYTKRRALEKKLHKDKEKLSQHHLITSSTELREELLAIDEESMSAAKKKNKNVSLLKTQIQIRKSYVKHCLLCLLVIENSDH